VALLRSLTLATGTSSLGRLCIMLIVIGITSRLNSIANNAD
jgi:hypothetical protein